MLVAMADKSLNVLSNNVDFVPRLIVALYPDKLKEKKKA